jgi:hypothetical protein
MCIQRTQVHLVPYMYVHLVTSIMQRSSYVYICLEAYML